LLAIKPKAITTYLNFCRYHIARTT